MRKSSLKVLLRHAFPISIHIFQFRIFIYLFQFWILNGRVEEVAARGVLAVREDSGGAGVQDAEAQRSSVGRLRGRLLRVQCPSTNAGFPFLWQAHGTSISIDFSIPTFFSLSRFRYCVQFFFFINPLSKSYLHCFSLTLFPNFRFTWIYLNYFFCLQLNLIDIV